MKKAFQELKPLVSKAVKVIEVIKNEKSPWRKTKIDKNRIISKIIKTNIMSHNLLIKTNSFIYKFIYNRYKYISIGNKYGAII